MISRIGYDLVRASLRLVIALWPLWLFWFAWRGSNIAWREVLLTFHGATRSGLPPRLSRLALRRPRRAGRSDDRGARRLPHATRRARHGLCRRRRRHHRHGSDRLAGSRAPRALRPANLAETSRHGRHPVRGDQRHRSRRRRRLLLWRTRLGDRRRDSCAATCWASRPRD